MELKRLKYLRIIHGLSQDNLASATEISQPKISRAERGFLKFSSEEKQKIAKILNVQPKELFPE